MLHTTYLFIHAKNGTPTHPPTKNRDMVGREGREKRESRRESTHSPRKERRKHLTAARHSIYASFLLVFFFAFFVIAAGVGSFLLAVSVSSLVDSMTTPLLLCTPCIARLFPPFHPPTRLPSSSHTINTTLPAPPPSPKALRTMHRAVLFASTHPPTHLPIPPLLLLLPDSDMHIPLPPLLKPRPPPPSRPPPPPSPHPPSPPPPPRKSP